MDVLFPYALWTLVSLIVIGSGIALLVWGCPPIESERVPGADPPQSLAERPSPASNELRDRASPTHAPSIAPWYRLPCRSGMATAPRRTPSPGCGGVVS